MRTTLTLDDDVEAGLKERMRRTGRSFREIVNSCLRDGLIRGEPRRPPRRFRVRSRRLGLREGLELNSVSAAIDQLDQLDQLDEPPR